jgi:undecaprenyl-diphosphatase
MMPIYSWEFYIDTMARTWPRDGYLFQFMHVVSDIKVTGYLIIPLLAVMIYKKGYKSFVLPFGMSLLATAFSETISRRVVKALVMRPRPNFIGLDCSDSACWGFVSSHATNLFSVAIFLSLYDKKNCYWTLPIAVLVSFSRIYLLDHFALDVIGGAVLGSVIGLFTWKFYSFVLKKFSANMFGSNSA